MIELDEEIREGLFVHDRLFSRAHLCLLLVKILLPENVTGFAGI